MSYPAAWGAEACPSDEELLAWMCGALAAPALSRLLHHTEQCAACALVVAEAGVVRGETEAHPASRLVPRPGAVFAAGQLVASRYHIERRLGRGGMGEVYVALDRELNERVALKTISTPLAADPRAVERLKLELRLARSVAHPHVCRVLELGRHELSDGSCQWFFTLQLIEGESLRHRLLRGGPPPLPEALVWAEQLALGLAAIHAQSVIHRDIKPENVMLTSTTGPSAALWVDFGLARVDLTDTRSPGLLQGTPDYSAPELLRGAVASRASDVYAFGVVLHELFTGSLPFARRASFSDLSERAVALHPELPPALAALVRPCLESAPERRSTVLELAERLRAAGAREEPSSVAEGGRASPRRWFFGLSIAVTLLGGSLLVPRGVSAPTSGSAHVEGDTSLEPPVDAPATIASTPAAPVRGTDASSRAVPRRLASARSAAAPPASAPLAEPPVTDFGGRR